MVMAMTLRLDTDHDTMIARLAAQLKCSKHEAVLRAIELADERINVKQRGIERAREILRTRDKDLLDRLADA
jgi:predicted transcriptional regulator